MIENSSKGYEGKQEAMAPSSSTSTTSRQWTAFRNPRIVRVSRSLGGKDRHSKVCTIRGLRDRRIRLSVPTAIELYDLQDRLGLSQPSKVIDWLIEATKSDIDKLPPLQIPHGFPQFHHQQTLLPVPPPYHHHHHHHHHESASTTTTTVSHPQFPLGGFFDANYNISTFLKDGAAGNHQNLLAKSRYYWDIIDSESRLIKGNKEELAEISTAVSMISQKGKRIKTSEEENDEDDDGGIEDSAQKLFPIGINNNSNSSLPAGLLNNNAMSTTTYNSSSYYHSSDPSTLSLSQFGSSHGLFPNSHIVDPTPSGVQFSSSSLAPVPSASQFPLFTPYAAPFMANYSSVECDPRQFNHIMPHHPLIRSLNSPLRRLPTPFTSKLLDSDNNNNRSQPNKGTRS